jgi:hypothetical protein
LLKDIEEPGGHGSLRRSGARELAAGHPEVEVVEHEEGEIEVPATGGEQMGAADAEASVPHGDDHVEFRPGELEAGGVGEGPTVEAMEGMGGEEGVEEPRAADVTHDDHLARREAEVLKGLIEGAKGLLMGAARAEDRRPVRIEEARHGAPLL